MLILTDDLVSFREVILTERLDGEYSEVILAEDS